jgi:hypothetical protein
MLLAADLTNNSQIQTQRLENDFIYYYFYGLPHQKTEDIS